MPSEQLPEQRDARLDWTGIRPHVDPVADPALFEGVLMRRVFAFMIDMAIVGSMFLMVWLIIIFSLGLLSGLLLPIAPLIPIVYHTLLISGRRSSTIGMQFLGLEVRTIDGGRPSLLQAFAMTALFYLSVTVTSYIV
ncbi:MAG: RDD family protein, partial [Alphaproteobacteria bacterium]|nr:RDD family protein [Alphaproteobacteria bacterium]